MSSENIAPRVRFRPWVEAGFTSELLPIIPPGAEISEKSTVRPEHRGKTPGVLNSSGTWGGLTGQWSETLYATEADAKKWSKWGASVGLQSRKFLGLDIDVEDSAVVDELRELAQAYLGFAPERYRDGSPRRLFMYEAGELIHKWRVAWLDKDGVKHACELLGHGQQFVCSGPHPKGGKYVWNEWPRADELTPIMLSHVEAFFAAVRDLVQRTGGQVVTGADGSVSSSTRKALTDTSLWAPRPELVLDALKAWKNTAENVPTHDDFVTALAAIKGALGAAAAAHFPDVLHWALGYEGNDEDYVTKTWDSIAETALGWEWLAGHARAAGFTGDADADFDDTGESDIAATPYDRVTARYVYVQQQDRFYDQKTGLLITPKAFNTANTTLAPYGSSGQHTAEAQFHNARAANKATIATYRPGKDLLLQEENEVGVPVRAVNLWRPSPLKPWPADVTDADVAPFRELTTELFGPEGEPAREHILDMLAFAVQYPGVKINHAPVLLGEQGVGKDTFLQPFIEAVGQHNVRPIKTEELAGQFTDFLRAQVCIVSEMASFSKREQYNRLKDWIAAPPLYVLVNRKNEKPFTIPNQQLWIFTTNYDNAIVIDEGDRRFWVHRCLLERPREREFYKRIYHFYEHEDGNAKVFRWLLQRDVSAFDPKARPPMTEAKRSMVDQSHPAGVRYIRDLFAEGGAFAARSVVITGELLETVRRDWNAPLQINSKNVIAALRLEGFRTTEHLRVRLVNEGMRQLWVRDPSGLLAQLSADKLRERYLAEVAEQTKAEAA